MAKIIWYVNGANGSDGNNCKSPKTACKTIGHAIALGPSGSVIFVGPSIYAENLTINSSLAIIGSGSDTTIIDGQHLNTVVSIPNSKAHVVIAGFTIRNGEASYDAGGSGGGIANRGTLVVFKSIITQNVAGDFSADDSDGAGIYNRGMLTLRYSTVSDNETEYSYFGYGGGIFTDGTATISDSTIANNIGGATDMYGTGIYNGGMMVVNRSVISGNQYAFDGSGIFNDRLGTATINNSTITGNGNYYSYGGGIANAGTLAINNSTISGNEASGTSGVVGPATIQNSIVADNLTGNCFGTMTSVGYNLSSDKTCNFNGPGDQNNVEPKLGPLLNNGGPTQTLAELAGSPTIDAGNPEGCTDSQGHLLKTDQRGFPRPGRFKRKHRCDMGAFERQRD